MMTENVIPWKGKTFNEIVSIKKRNNWNSNSIFKANPLKLYRRETVLNTSYNCNPKISSSVSMMEMPGATVVNSSATTKNGIQQTVDFNYNENKCEKPCSVASLPFSKENDARRRVRSSGMNNRNFYTSTKQYLESRTRTFQQNQYYNIRQGDETVKPGSATSLQNIYSSNGLSHCKKFTFVSDASFSYQWIDGLYSTVTVPAGDYNEDNLNYVLKNTMISNYHYIVEKQGNTKVLLLNLSFNQSQNKMELTVTPADTSIFPTNDYELPKDEYGDFITTWSIPINTVLPGITVVDNAFKNAIGFAVGNYPSVPIGSGTQDLNTVQFLSTSEPLVKPQYVPIYYKPNNPQYSQQGAVTASSRLLRLKYNSITNSAVEYQNAYGKSVANALAYGVPEGGYTIKDKIGYPLKQTPKFGREQNAQQKNCIPTTIRNIM